MENASKALLMAAGVLVGVLILALMFTLFLNARSVSSSYEQRKQSEAIQQFNVNFTKYLGQDLTIHQVVTICNFAKIDSNKVYNVTIDGTEYDATNIKTDLELASNKLSAWTQYYNIEVIYKLNILQYNTENGYVSKIKFTQETGKKFKCYKKDPATGNTIIEYKS